MPDPDLLFHKKKDTKVMILPPATGTTASWHRLTREELREFIQLELDLASQQYKA